MQECSTIYVYADKIKATRVFVLLVLAFSLANCSTSSQHIAPVVGLITQPIPASGVHVVNRGETLYEIAWQYGKDFRDLAALNHIESPYTIYPGQKLILKGKVVLPKKVVFNKVKKPVAVMPNVPKPIVSEQGWEWPVKGKVIKSFALKGVKMNKGIDIAGQQGTPIKAASGGKVVYSGSALRGYGQLIILKHNDVYLSAYAHNHQLLVKEGDSVQKGQVIAKMGRTDTDEVKLHFEIRKNGNPIDPMLILKS